MAQGPPLHDGWDEDDWNREAYVAISRGTFPYQVQQQQRGWADFDFDSEDGQHRISKAMTNIFRRTYDNRTWLTKRMVYEKLRFRPLPTRQQFEAVFQVYSHRFHVWPWRCTNARGETIWEDWYLLKDQERDQQMLREERHQAEQQRLQTINELTPDVPRGYENYLDELFPAAQDALQPDPNQQPIAPGHGR